MTKLMLVAATALLATTSLASARDTTSDIDRRQSNQEQRILEGRRDGSLTRYEARQLELEQARIRELERRAKADGHVDRREAAVLRNAQGEAGRHIAQEQHDSQKSGWRSWSKRWW